MYKDSVLAEMSGQWRPTDPLLLEFAGEQFDVEARATDILRQGYFIHIQYPHSKVNSLKD